MISHDQSREHSTRNFMRHSRGFILIEIMTALTLHAMFLITLCGTFYLLLDLGARTQQILTARDHGQMVIDYIDQRIRNAGVGLWKCDTPSKMMSALGALANSKSRPLGSVSCLPIDISWDDNKPPEIYEGPNIITYHGNILTLLYARREFNSATRLVIATYDYKYNIISIDKGRKKQVGLLAGTNSNHKSSRFIKLAPNQTNDLNAWAVMESSGVPMYLSSWITSSSNVKVDIAVSSTAPSYADISSGSELLYLECEKMFAGYDVTETGAEKSFRANRVSGQSWAGAQPRGASILEIYFELGTEANKEMPHVLNLYVLASGGRSRKIITEKKPRHWPEPANWKDEYKYHTVYVSRASWKLENLSLFRWN